jgi:hypothetical protein
VIRRFSFMLSVERLLRFTVPPSEPASLSGVWPFVTSSASNIEPVIVWMRVARAMPPCEPMSAPSIVMVFIAGGMPRTVKPMILPSSLRLPATPGSSTASSLAFIFGKLP